MDKEVRKINYAFGLSLENNTLIAYLNSKRIFERIFINLRINLLG